MKNLLTCLTAFTSSLLVIGQETESFNYQTIVHNLKGEIVATQTVSIRVSILSGINYDTVVYTENHRVTTNKLGSVTISIGKGIGKTGNFEALDWNTEKYFLKVEVDDAGGTTFREIGTTQILSVPYGVTQKTSKKAYRDVDEDKLFIRRKYVGQFVDYRHTGPDTYNGPNLLWIKTSLDRTFGKISAFGKKCEFSVGDRLYLKRTYYSPGGVFGFWLYQIENDSAVYYKVTDFQNDHKVMVDTWFNSKQ